MSMFGHLLERYLDYIYQDTVRRRYAAQRACMERNPAARLLDIGCQTGVNTLLLAQAADTRHIVGLDYNARTLREAAAKGICVLVGDANHPLPFADASFDAVTMMDVLEHLVDPRLAIGEARRVLRPGGYLVIATPNLASWHNILALVLGLQPFSGPNLTSMFDADLAIVQRLHRQAYRLPTEGQVESHVEQELHRHIVVAAYRALVRLVEREGLHVEWARGFGYYPLPPFLGRLCARLDPWHAHHIVIKARKPMRMES